MRKIKKISNIPDNLNINSTRNISNQDRNLQRINTSVGRAELSFPGYSNTDNKINIRSLAKGCCAYCGTKIDGEKSIEVEHYRPKKLLEFRKDECRIENLFIDEKNRKNKFEVIQSPSNYGYFLWGDDHENLLPACNACNKGEGNNGTYVANVDSTGNLEYKIPYGKKNFFPIYSKGKDSRLRCNYISDISSEKPLLFNPYFDDPSELFTYKKLDICNRTKISIIKIRPNPKESNKNRLKAEVSINLLGLNRQTLCVKRAVKNRVMKKIAAEFVLIRKGGNAPKISIVSNLINDYLVQVMNDPLGLHGYSCAISKKLAIGIRNETINKYPEQSNGILNRRGDFDNTIKQLELFVQTYPFSIEEQDEEVDELVD